MYQIIVSAIKFIKVFYKFMIWIALFKKFLREQFILSFEVCNMARCIFVRLCPKSGHILVLSKHVNTPL